MNFKKCICILIIGLLPVISAGQIKPLSIGDRFPDLKIGHVLNNSIEQVDLSDYKGKAIIIDFWATWCSPCISALPLMDSLQRIYKKDLQVFSVTGENDKLPIEVLTRVFGDAEINLMVITRDTLLSKYFPYKEIPHYVWIGKDGLVKAITDKEEVNDLNIRYFIAGNTLGIKNKINMIRYDFKRPVYASKQAIIGDELVYQSLVARYRPDINTFSARGKTYISCLNAPVARLFQLAYGKFDLQYLALNRLIAEGISKTDSITLGFWSTDEIFNSWSKSIAKNAYSYEIMVPDSTFSNDQLFEIMQQDLNRYFGIYGITGHMEKRKRKVMALVEISGKANYQSKPGKPEHYSISGFLKMSNEPMDFFLSQLQPYLPKDTPAIVNKTGYKGNITVELKNGINNITSINKSLAIYGLKLEEREELLDMVVITKNPNSKREL